MIQSVKELEVCKRHLLKLQTRAERIENHPQKSRRVKEMELAGVRGMIEQLQQEIHSFESSQIQPSLHTPKAEQQEVEAFEVCKQHLLKLQTWAERIETDPNKSELVKELELAGVRGMIEQLQQEIHSFESLLKLCRITMETENQQTQRKGKLVTMAQKIGEAAAIVDHHTPEPVKMAVQAAVEVGIEISGGRVLERIIKNPAVRTATGKFMNNLRKRSKEK